MYEPMPPDPDAASAAQTAGDARMLRLTLLQFFVGGLVLNVAAFWLLASTATDYDGIVSLAVMVVFAVVVALASMIGAMLIGLPVRLVARIRSRWLANGEVTVIGAVVGLAGCVVTLSVAPVLEISDAYGTSEVRDANSWLLLAAWSVFAISVAHFVWPRRWGRQRG